MCDAIDIRQRDTKLRVNFVHQLDPVVLTDYSHEQHSEQHVLLVASLCPNTPAKGVHGAVLPYIIRLGQYLSSIGLEESGSYRPSSQTANLKNNQTNHWSNAARTQRPQ